MRSNVQETTLCHNIREIDNKLVSIEKSLKEMVRLSVEEITNNPAQEKELISLWANHSRNISDFFFEECERTGNKELYKGIVKSLLFNK
ncbi:MAG: hypothetical protein Q8936_08875 [Bacillota bacterium]|nr:hypothetical protein [Bacillota bacterium]